MADFLTVFGNSGYNYGSTPSLPVAEQNQTYFAYFNGVGGTGPEYIDGTGYFIKYLIDINGNVVNPEPYTETTSIEAVPLHNLKANFEIGKNAIVKTVEPDPTQDTSPNANILTGNHRIAHVGKIVPILVTETGISNDNYIRTMSFGPLISQVDDPVRNVSARMFYVNNTDLGYFFANDSVFGNFPFNSNTNLGDGAWVQDGYKLIAQSSSIEARTRIRFQARIYIDARDMVASSTYFSVRVIKNDVQIVYQNNAVLINRGFNDYMTFGPSNYIDFEVGDEFKLIFNNANGTPAVTTYQNYQFKILGYKETFGYVSDTSLTIEQETPASPGGLVSNELIDGVNAIYAFPSTSPSASYCNIIDFPTQSYSDIVFFSSSRFIYDNNLIQNLDPLSIGFSPINIPFGDTGPGDFIRFEYNKNQTYTIVDVIKDYEILGVPTPDTLAFRVTPNIGSTPGINTNIQKPGHFVIYRVLNDGLYVTLDVAKDAPGGAYTGLLLPEFVTQELSEKLETLIQDLTQKEIIQ